MTIDELAQAGGVPSRTIREYQRLRLLPPPRRQSRSGIYGETHLRRLGVIARLQGRGYSLAAIGDLLDNWEAGHGLGSVLGADADPAVLDEVPTEMTTAELVRLAPCLGTNALLARLVEVGIVRLVGDRAVIVRSVAVIELVGEAERAGMEPEAAVGMALSVRGGAAQIAAGVVDAFLTGLWDSRASNSDIGPLVRRARLLLAQSAASLVVDRLGGELGRAARLRNDSLLAELVEEIRIGALRTLPPPDLHAG